MAQIPTDQLFGPQIKEQPRVIQPTQSAEAAAAGSKAGSELSKSLFNLVAQEDEMKADAERARLFSEISTDINMREADLTDRMAGHTDHNTYMAAWSGEHKKIRDEAMEKARTDQYVYQSVIKNLDQVEATLYAEHKGKARKLLVDNTIGTLDEAVYAAGMSARSELQAKQAILNLLVQTNAAEASGILSRAEAAKRRTKDREFVLGNLASWLMEHDVEEFERLYSLGSAGIFGGLSADKLLAYGDEALTRKWKLEDRQEKNLNKLYARSRAVLTSQIWDGLVNKKDLDAMLANRLIRDEDYDDLLHEMNRENTGDRTLYDALRVKLYDPSQTKEVNFESIRRSNMPNKFKSLLMKELADVREKSTRFGDGHSVALARIKTSVAPSLLSLNPQAEEGKQFLRVSRLFLDWEASHPEATAFELGQKADEFIAQSQAVKTQRKVGKNPYLEGVRDEETRKAALKRLGEDWSKDKRKSGLDVMLHTKEEYMEWMEEIESWRAQ